MNASFEKLWIGYLEGALTPEQRTTLAELLESNPEFAEAAARDKSMSGLLEKHFHRGADGFVSNCLAQFHALRDQPAPEAPKPVISVGRLIVEKPSVSTNRKVKKERRMFFGFSAIACAVGIAIVIAGNWQAWLSQNNPIPAASNVPAIKNDSLETNRSGIARDDEPIIANNDGKSNLKTDVHSDPTSGQLASEEKRPTDQTPRNEVPNAEQLDGLKPPSETALAANAEANQTIKSSVENGTPPKESPGFRLTTSPSAKWQSDVPPAPGVGSYDLLSGSAELFFPDGSSLKMRGPVKLKVATWNFLANEQNVSQPPAGDVLDRYKVTVESGELELKLAGNGSPTVFLPLLNIRSQNDAVVQMRAQKDGTTEVLLKAGVAEIAQQDAEQKSGIQLRRDKLRQVFAQRLENAPGAVQDLKPTLLMARGATDFEGRVKLGEHTARVESPVQMSYLIQELMDQSTSNRANFAAEWQEFSRKTIENGKGIGSLVPGLPESMSQEFRRMLRQQQNGPAKQFLRDNRSSATTQFEGTLNVNGKSFRFSDPNKFFKAFGANR